MVIEVVEEVTTVIIECSGEKHNDECCTEVQMQEKEATEYEPQTWSGEEGSESITTFQTELQNWVGSLRDNMMKVHVAEEKKRQTDGVQKCYSHMCTWTSRMQECHEKTTVPGGRFTHQKRSEERRRNPEISIQGNKWSSLRSEDGCRQVCCTRPSAFPGETERRDIL